MPVRKYRLFSTDITPRRARLLPLFAVCLALAVVPLSLAQKDTGTTRKVVATVKPAYPATLKNLHIEGIVRLTAVVLPNGNVAKIEVRGGNPILVENAVKAVKNWKYAANPAQTEEEIVLNFSDR